MKRIIAVLNEPRTIHEYVVYAQFVVERVAADPTFVSPRPPIAVLGAGSRGRPARERRGWRWGLWSTATS